MHMIFASKSWKEITENAPAKNVYLQNHSLNQRSSNIVTPRINRITTWFFVFSENNVAFKYIWKNIKKQETGNLTNLFILCSFFAYLFMRIFLLEIFFYLIYFILKSRMDIKEAKNERRGKKKNKKEINSSKVSFSAFNRDHKL